MYKGWVGHRGQENHSILEFCNSGLQVMTRAGKGFNDPAKTLYSQAGNAYWWQGWREEELIRFETDYSQNTLKLHWHKS